MLKKLLIPGIFLLLVAAQWAIPLDMIRSSNLILTEGKPFRFKCAPIDPNDPFRGKYITLSFEAEQYLMDSALAPQPGETVWLRMTTDSAGYAKIASLTENKPENLGDYMETEVSTYLMEGDSSLVFFIFPFERFYLEETKAPKAEALYQENLQGQNATSYALIYLLNGEARIQEVYLDGKPLSELLKNP